MKPRHPQTSRLYPTQRVSIYHICPFCDNEVELVATAIFFDDLNYTFADSHCDGCKREIKPTRDQELELEEKTDYSEAYHDFDDDRRSEPRYLDF